MTISPLGLLLWSAAGVPLLGSALAFGGLLTLSLWTMGGVGAAIVLRMRAR